MNLTDCRRARSKASLQSFCSMVGISPAWHQVNHSPLVHCVGGPYGCGPTRWVQSMRAHPLQQENKRPREGIPFVHQSVYFRYHALAVSMPILANAVFPDITDRRFSYFTQTLLSICLLSSPFSQ